MLLKSYAKINLSLLVNKKLRSGLHDIQSLFCLIDLSDKIEIQKVSKKKDKIIFKGLFANNVKNSNNSIKILLILLRKHKLISNFYSVVIHKNIPVFAGLGGGTSNAVSVFKQLVKKKVKKNILSIIEKKIGSDLRLFYFQQGFLKDLKTIIKIKKKYKLYFLLVYPYIKCSTREIYSKVKNYSKKIKFNQNGYSAKFFFTNYASHNKNDLQAIVEKKYPIIKKLLDNIRLENGCFFSRMSGSGSVCYGVFNTERRAKVALRKIKKKYPKFWFSVAKTI